MNMLYLSLSLIFIPICTGIFLFIIPKKIKYIQESLSFLASLTAFLSSIYLFIQPKTEINFLLLNFGEITFNFNLLTTSLNTFLLLFVTGFGFFITLYSFRYMLSSNSRKKYYIFMLITIGSASGVLLTNHFLLFLIFWEIVSASLYFLITTGKDSKDGATKTFGMIGASDGCLLIGITLLWFLSGTLTISDINIPVNSALSYTAYFFILIGALTKAGSMPFHTWIPAASKGAPSTVMALLPASIDKLLGIYLLYILSTKLFIINEVLGITLMSLGAITIVFAVMMALIQHDLPQLLSYHAVSQVGYMILGIGTMTPIGLAGGIFHMLNNSIYKSCLFLCGGSVEHKTNTQDLESLGGLARTMPYTFFAFIICMLSISGVPPFNGFISKWMIYQGVLETRYVASFFFLAAAMFGSALTLASFVKVLFSVFLGNKSKITGSVKNDVGFFMKLPMIVFALLCIVLGVFFNFCLTNFIYPALNINVTYSGVFNSIIATGLIIAGLLLGLIIYKIGKTAKYSKKVPSFIGGETIAEETARVPGSEFYNTIKSISPIGNIYKKQEKGWFDLYKIFTKLGYGVTFVLKVLHNGFLPFYLAWTLLGTAVLILLLYLF